MIKLYILLLFFEGVFRKWFPLTGLDVFYVLRDGIMICSILFALIRNRISMSPTIKYINFFLITLIFLAALQTLFNPIQNAILLLGLRNYLAPLILLYYLLINKSFAVFHEILFRLSPYLVMLETFLCVIQAISPRSGFLNLTTTGNNAIVTSGLQVRPLGTFTSSLGFSFFLCFSYSFCLSVYKKWSIRKSIIVFSCIFLSIALSGTRIVPMNVLFVTVVYFLFLQKGSGKLKFLSFSIFSVSVIFLIVSNSVLRQVWSAFQTRVKYQTEGSAGTVSRILNPLIGIELQDLSFLGNGIGKHHASAFPYLGSNSWIEIESFRWIAELGIIGLILYAIRVLIPLIAITRAILNGKFDEFHFMLAGLIPFLVFGGVTTQPTVQGFSGLFICSAYAYKLKSKKRDINHE